MSRYLKDIIRYFFSHEVSEETTSRVHARMVHAANETDSALQEIWDELDCQSADDENIDDAYRQTELRLFGRSHAGRNRFWMRIAAIWAVPLLMLGAAWYFYQAGGTKETNADVTFVHKFTAYGECEMVILPDSTKVWLNGGSTIIYPSHFVAEVRNVCLSGEAFFDVTKDAQKPFVVDVNQIELKVLGTTFNVSSYPNNEEITATLETGKIQLTVEGKASPYFLNPNDQLTYNSKTGEVSISQVNASNYSSWRSGDLFFNNMPFEKVVEQLERSYSVKFYVLNKKHNDQTLRAHFSSKDSVKDVLEILKMLIPEFKYEIKGNNIYIK